MRGGRASLLRLVLVILTLSAASTATVPLAAAPQTNFAEWHLPVPAGEWLISRGPCGSGGLFQHQCGYYEDRCALDLTAASGEMEGVPVLAPLAGQVFFLGTRSDSGLTVMLEHDDGRVTALMHLSKVVVASDQRVTQGQVVAYAGSSGSSSRPHLHFHVQPNAVERECLPLGGLDEIDWVRLTVRSHNLDWTELTLVDPPADLPAWLPLAAPNAQELPAVLPRRLVLAPDATVDLPVAYGNARIPDGGLTLQGQAVPVALRTSTHTVFTVPFSAPGPTGEYSRMLRMAVMGTGNLAKAVRFSYSVRPVAENASSAGLVLINPTFVGPPNWSTQDASPELCWRESTAAGVAPLSFRALVVGPARADSGWISEQCWQTPALPPGDYSWKVFVRDGQGYMNRTNQRPYVFRMR